MPTYYFHGTKGSFRRGDIVRPRAEHRGAPTEAPTVDGSRAPDSDNWVHVTTRFSLAWAYAHASGESGNPIVLVVEPEGVPEIDPEHSDWMQAYRCESARVIAVDAAPPFSPEEAARHWKPAIEDVNASAKAHVVKP
jgi:hypothetical protein